MAKKKLGERLKELFSSFKLDDEFFEDLEDCLLESDLGGKVTMELSDQLQEICRKEKLTDRDAIVKRLRDLIGADIRSTIPEPAADGLTVFLVLGVNGVGKTTSIAKMARYWESQGFGKALLAAGDTFRAAAIEQLKIQGERTGCRVVSQSIGSDPGAVIYDALESARARGEKIVIADTAGRLHNKKHLVRELEKINKVIDGRLQPGDRCCHLLVIDATTGQNGFQQAEAFHEAVGLDGIILTKYDSSARGGIVPSICRNLDIPFAFLGRGEGLDDWEVFNTENYLDDLLEGL